MDQRPAPQAPPGHLRRAVEMLAAVQVVIEPSQEAVHRVARPPTTGMGIGHEDRLSLGAQGQHLLPDDLLVHVGLGPLPQAIERLFAGAWLDPGS